MPHAKTKTRKRKAAKKVDQIEECGIGVREAGWDAMAQVAWELADGGAIWFPLTSFSHFSTARAGENSDMPSVVINGGHDPGDHSLSPPTLRRAVIHMKNGDFYTLSSRFGDAVAHLSQYRSALGERWKRLNSGDAEETNEQV